MVNENKNLIRMMRGIPLESKHIRWNLEKSKDNFYMDIPFARYYFAIVDQRDTYRKEMEDKIINRIVRTGSSIIPIGEPFELRVKQGKYGLLFVTYDTLSNPENLSLETLNVPLKRDYQLKDKKVFDIKDYLIRIYE